MGEDCTDNYHYQDYDGLAVDLLYGHVFGAIHCDCSPEQVCSGCGNGVVEVAE